MMTAKRFRHGLVVGKFCPLHRGHELLIEHALAACNDLTIISYTKPEFQDYNPTSRATWLRSLFPSAHVLAVGDESLSALCADRSVPFRPIPHNEDSDEAHRKFVGWLCWKVLGHTVDAVFTSEDYGDGFAQALSAYFSNCSSATAHVAHVCVDKSRLTVPISGTTIRSNLHLHRDYLSPAVYASFVKRLCFLGGESSGKTTLAQALAERFSTEWVREYGRELWDRKSGKLEFSDMLEIAREQVARESLSAGQARRLLLCDTSPLTTLFYSQAMFGQVDQELEELAKRPYDFVFLCSPDFPFVQDGTRKDDNFRWRQHDWYISELKKRGIRYHVLQGPLESRIEKVTAVVNDR